MAFDSVQQWFDRLGTRSEVTKKAYLDDLILYCEWCQKTPDQLKQERKQELKSDDEDVKRTAERRLSKYANSGVRAQSSIRRAVESIKSFYNYNYMKLEGMKAPAIVREKDYRCPTVEDVRKMLEGSNLRDRAIFLTLFQTGIREGTLIHLKLKHIKELFEGKSPVHIGLRSQELKGTYAGLEAHTFLGKDAIDAINKYLNWRKDIKGETLSDDSYLFTRLDALGQPLGVDAILQHVTNACKQAGMAHFSPHDFRRAFQTNLEASGIPANWIKKMMGHRLAGEEQPYSIPKIEQLREAYARAEPKMSLTIILQANRLEILKHKMKSLCDEEGTTIPDLIEELQKYEPNLGMILNASGKTIAYKFASEQEKKDYELHFNALDELEEKQVEAYEKALRAYEREQLKESLKEELIKELGLEKKKKTMTNGNGHYESKIVKENELPKYLDSGWEFVASLNHEKYIVRKASD